ncbi:MAG: hypothetical protein Q7R34_11105 [Dehalococcoidia bacterium]|nr:hypothetical protein [Dehalococcoidia bacterium]
MNLFKVNPGHQNIYDSLTDFMLLALVVALTRQLEPPRLATPLVPATIPADPENKPAGMQEKPSISHKEPVRIPAQLRRQRDRYIRHWTEAMFKPE